MGFAMIGNSILLSTLSTYTIMYRKSLFCPLRPLHEVMSGSVYDLRKPKVCGCLGYRGSAFRV